MDVAPNPRIRAAVVLELEDKVLLVRHQKGDRSYWLVPGGGVEYGEAVVAAARRELLEETGLDVAVKDLLMVTESLAPDLSRHVVHMIFRGDRVGGKLALGTEEGETEQRLAEVAWIPRSELVNLVMHPPIGQALLAALDGKSLSLYHDGLWKD